MDYQARAALRSVKNITGRYTSAEVAVREATSNDPWGAPKQLLTEIGEMTYDPSQFKEIMDMIYKRLNDSGKKWRHVYKALGLLDYLIKNGSERVAEYVRSRSYELTTLKEFQYVDETGKDHGNYVRIKSKEIASLVQDPARVKEERKKAKELNERLAGNSISVSSDSYDSYSRRQTSGSSYSDNRSSSAMTDEEREFQRALEESRQEYEREQARRSQWEAADRAQVDAFTSTLPPPKSGQSRPTRNTGFDGDFDDFQSGRSANNSDPFGDAFVPQPNKATASNTAAAKSVLFGDDGFGTSSSSGAAAVTLERPRAASAASRHQATAAAAAASKPVDPFADFESAGSGSGFDAAFDGGKEAKKLPHQLAGKNDPNALIAEIARNAPQFDPFAQHARARAASTNTSFPATTTATPGIAIPGAGMGMSAPTPANSFTQPSFMAPTPANSFTQPSPFGAMAMQQQQNPFGPQPGAFPPANAAMYGGAMRPQQPMGAMGMGGMGMGMGGGMGMGMAMGGGAAAPSSFGAASSQDPFAGMGGTSSTMQKDPFANLAAPLQPQSSDPFASLTSGTTTSSDPFASLLTGTQTGLNSNPFGSSGSSGFAPPKNNKSLNELKSSKAAAPGFGYDPNANSFL